MDPLSSASCSGDSRPHSTTPAWPASLPSPPLARHQLSHAPCRFLSSALQALLEMAKEYRILANVAAGDVQNVQWVDEYRSQLEAIVSGKKV